MNTSAASRELGKFCTSLSFRRDRHEWISRKQLKKLIRTAAASAKTRPEDIAAAIGAGLRRAPIQVKVKMKEPPPLQVPRFTCVVRNDDGSQVVERSNHANG